MPRRLGIYIGIAAILVLIWVNDLGPDQISIANPNPLPASTQLEFAQTIQAPPKREETLQPGQEAQLNPMEFDIIPIEEEEVDAAFFPDLPEHGDCNLVVSFIDATTGEPVSGEVKLYRLDAPGNDYWSKGDQLQLQARTNGNELTAQNIPQGEYRAYPLFARLNAPTPAAFKVEGYLTRVTQPVEMPLQNQIQLQLFRSDGVLYGSQNEAVEFRKLSLLPRGFGKPEPDWLKQRTLKDPSIQLFTEYSFSEVNPNTSWQSFPYRASGYQLWQISSNNRQQAVIQRLEARVIGSSANTIELKPNSDGLFAAIYVDPHELQRALAFPVNCEPFDLSKDFKVQVTAVALAEVGGRTLENAWHELTVNIQLKHEGFVPVKMSWRPSQEPLPTIQLISTRVSD